MTEKTLSLLGASGTIGTQAAELARAQGYRILAMSAHGSAERLPTLIALAREHRPQLIAVNRKEARDELAVALQGEPTEIVSGEEGQIAAASVGADLTLVGIVGMAALKPALAAIQHSPKVALANKECLVSAGALLMSQARKHDCQILPADSEHNAIFQLLQGRAGAPSEVMLTASGGPFLDADMESLHGVSAKDAVRHPIWTMGAKISVDSATMMNKGLELMEARHLFGLEPQQLSVVIHPQSLVHGMVRFADGSLLAGLAMPDMRLPLAYCLAWPDRSAQEFARLDFTQSRRMDFFPPRPGQFPCLELAEAALAAGGVAPIVLNAANEEAVGAFLNGEIGFLGIAGLNESVLEWASGAKLTLAPDNLDDILNCDAAARARAQEQIRQRASALV